MGRTARAEAIDLGITGMNCASCVGRVERALGAVPGVSGAAVNLATGQARVTGKGVSIAALVGAVAAAGYVAAPLEEVAPRDVEAEIAEQWRRFVLAAVLTLPLFVLEMGGHLLPGFHHWLIGLVGQRNLYIAEFLLASAVLAGPGRVFFLKGGPALWRMAPDMNALVMLGAGAAWGYSTVATFAPGLLPPGTAQVYFEAAAVIVTLILLGRFLEARARGRASAAISRLVGLSPKTARRLVDGVESEVALVEIVPGDVLRARPGEKIAVDGEVVAGNSFVDEAMISGEPAPVQKQPGDEVIGGTINGTGGFTYRATRVGSETLLAQILRLVEAAQGDKLPIQAMVDRVTLWFVPAVMAVAALTFVAWLGFGGDPARAMVSAVAVLIVACPCAMGLATPTSILVGSGRAAELGMLFRRGAALQGLSGVDVVAFDKTGTLTEGRPRLTDLDCAPGHSRAEALALIAGVEEGSEHPLGMAILAAARDEGTRWTAAAEFASVPGMGVTGLVDGRRVVVGAERYLTSLGIDVSGFEAIAARLAGLGSTPVHAAVDGKALAVLAVADAVKPSSARAVAELRAAGTRVVMITGDNERAARVIAAELGIEEVFAGLLPAGKVGVVKDLRGAGGRVAFVGDGVNDAPALAEADVGIAVGTGTDIAIEAAEVVLISGDPLKVTAALGLSRAVMRNIRQGLFWAFAYNTALIPVAAGLFYPAFGILLSPVLAAGAMALSSVFVVGNALRLRRYGAGAAAAAGGAGA